MCRQNAFYHCSPLTCLSAAYITLLCHGIADLTRGWTFRLSLIYFSGACPHQQLCSSVVLKSTKVCVGRTSKMDSQPEHRTLILQTAVGVQCVTRSQQ